MDSLAAFLFLSLFIFVSCDSNDFIKESRKVVLEKIKGECK